MDVFLVHEGITIGIQTFVEVLVKPKGVILCNTLIIKTIPYFIVEIYIYIYDEGITFITFTLLLCNTFGTRQNIGYLQVRVDHFGHESSFF